MDLVAGRVYADERRPIRHIDGFLLLVTTILLLLGFILIYSATNQTLRLDRLDPFARVNRQMVTAVIGMVLLLFMATFDYRFLKVYAGFIFVGVLLSLVLVHVPFLGSSAEGAQRWFEFAGGAGGLQITPSEFAKIGLIVMLAASLSELKRDTPTVQDLIRICGIALVPLMLVFIQPDIGTSIVFVAIAGGMLLVAGVRGRHLGALLAISLVMIAAAFQLGVVKEYQLDRLRAFIDRENTPADVRYNLDQAEIAVGSGGLFGQGYLHGRQTTLDYVPEQHTDFIFTVAGEEFGFVGAVFVLTLFALLLWRSIRIAFLSKDPFGTYLATGVAVMFAVQMFVNIGMVIGIMPITGIPLPFLSYGGSSMLVSCMGVGILLNVHMRRFK
jgi:rod shape determining protein RodA